MTAIDPDSGEADVGAGQFPVVLRGYDRQLVEARLGELAGQLEQERRQRRNVEQRLDQVDGGNALAVRDQPQAAFLSLGARAAKVFEEAGAVAERLIGEAQEQARLIIDAAQAEAGERLKAAENQASALEQMAGERLAEAEATQMRIEAEAAEAAEAVLADAEHGAQAQRAEAREEIRRAWQKADRERQLLEAEAQRLQTLRRILADQLGQVHTHLGLALRATDDGGENQDESDVEASRAESPDAATRAHPGQRNPRGRRTQRIRARRHRRPRQPGESVRAAVVDNCTMAGQARWSRHA